MTLLVTSNKIFDLQIREKLVSKQATEDRLEKVRKLRELKKFGKKVQQEVTIKRAKEKREMLDQVILKPRRYTKLFRFLNLQPSLNIL